MHLFMPERVYFEPSSLDYPLGRTLHEFFQKEQIPIIQMTDNRVTGIPGNTEQEKYIHAKRTLVVGVKKSLKLEPCKPSADFQFPLATSCPGNCEYCYLQTTQGKRPYIRLYVNLEDLFDSITTHIEKRLPDITTFEVASTSDPLSLEHLTGALRKTIEFFGALEHGRLRVVTKYSHISPLLDAVHNGHTRFRFSINADYVIRQFEHGTASLTERLEAASRIIQAGYPTGFIIAPIMVFDHWREQYEALLKELAGKLEGNNGADITFELIQHRYTNSARNLIHQRFPNTKLDMEDSRRIKKWGQYGIYKYVYPKDLSLELKEHLSTLIKAYLPQATIEYFT